MKRFWYSNMHFINGSHFKCQKYLRRINKISFCHTFIVRTLIISNSYFIIYSCSRVVPGISYFLLPGTSKKVLVLIQFYHQNNILWHILRWQNYTMDMYHQTRNSNTFCLDRLAQIITFFSNCFFGNEEELCVLWM